MSQAPKFSGIFDNILQGVQVGLPLAAGLFGGSGKPKGVCGQSLLTKDGDIALCLDQLIPQLCAGTAQMPLAQKIQAYEIFLSAVLRNPQYFKQSASKHYLGNQRDNVFPAEIAKMKSDLAALTASASTSALAIQSNDLIEGIPNIYLFGVFGLFGMALILKR